MQCWGILSSLSIMVCTKPCLMEKCLRFFSLLVHIYASPSPELLFYVLTLLLFTILIPVLFVGYLYPCAVVLWFDMWLGLSADKVIIKVCQSDGRATVRKCLYMDSKKAPDHCHHGINLDAAYGKWKCQKMEKDANFVTFLDTPVAWL